MTNALWLDGGCVWLKQKSPRPRVHSLGLVLSCRPLVVIGRQGDTLCFADTLDHNPSIGQGHVDTLRAFAFAARHQLGQGLIAVDRAAVAH